MFADSGGLFEFICFVLSENRQEKSIIRIFKVNKIFIPVKKTLMWIREGRKVYISSSGSNICHNKIRHLSKKSQKLLKNNKKLFLSTNILLTYSLYSKYFLNAEHFIVGLKKKNIVHI